MHGADHDQRDSAQSLTCGYRLASISDSPTPKSYRPEVPDEAVYAISRLRSLGGIRRFGGVVLVELLDPVTRSSVFGAEARAAISVRAPRLATMRLPASGVIRAFPGRAL